MCIVFSENLKNWGIGLWKNNKTKDSFGQPRGLVHVVLYRNVGTIQLLWYACAASFITCTTAVTNWRTWDLPRANRISRSCRYMVHLVYMTSIIGGWVSDRVLGAKTYSVLLVVVFIMLGHIVLATPFGVGALLCLLSMALIIIRYSVLETKCIWYGWSFIF
jgi:POT family proton-dependent oligopeptide transporter